MTNTINEGPSTKTFTLMMVALSLLSLGAALTVTDANKKRAAEQDRQGCAYFAKHTIDEVPVACYDFYIRSNHWKQP